MQRLLDAFVKNKDGEWFCRSPITVEGTFGRVNITPGVTYRLGQHVGGLDIVALLESCQATGRLPPNIVLRE
jgi:hypothetical protein